MLSFPCNFPLYQILFKILPLLLAGNSVVINPPIQSPHGILRVAEISVLAGLPKGLFNVLPGFTHRAGKAIALHHDIDRLFVYMPWGSKTYSLNFANPIKPLKQILLNFFVEKLSRKNCIACLQSKSTINYNTLAIGIA